MRSGLLVAGLIVAAATVVGLGIDRWRDERQAAHAVESLLAALQQGDREAAAALFAPERRERAMAAPANDHPGLWRPQSVVHYHTNWVRLTGDQAAVKARIAAGDVTLRPVFRLRRIVGEGWRIVSVEGLVPDSSPGDDPNVQLAEELQTAFSAESLRRE